MKKCGITGFKGNLGKTFLKVNNKFRYFKFRGDVRKKKQLENWLKNNKFDFIIHFAAIVPTYRVNNNYKKALDINYNGTKHLVDGIIKYQKDISWFFFASTSHVYPFQNKKITEKSKTKSISKYGETISKVLSLKPGITGLWQVSGRNNLSYKRRVFLDNLYVEKYDFIMDLRIIIRTFGVLFFPMDRGAY